jgi:hypothetical protein
VIAKKPAKTTLDDAAAIPLAGNRRAFAGVCRGKIVRI